MNEGWIKLDRALLDWEWITDATTLQVWIFFLLKANHEEGKWRGLVIKSGQFVSSNRKIADFLGRDRNTINQAISNLLSTGEITKEAIPNHFTIYTITNYHKYQFGGDDGIKVGIENGRKIQPNSHPKQEVKKQEERNNNIVVAVDTRTHEEQLNEILSEQGWIETVCMNNHISLQQFNELIPEFNLEMAAQGKTNHNSVQDLKYHINSFIRKRLEIKQKQQRNGNKSNIQGERGIIDQEQWTQSTLQAIEEARRRHNSQSV